MQNVFCKLCNDNILESLMHNKMLKVLRNSYYNFHSLLHELFTLRVCSQLSFKTCCKGPQQICCCVHLFLSILNLCVTLNPSSYFLNHSSPYLVYFNLLIASFCCQWSFWCVTTAIGANHLQFTMQFEGIKLFFIYGPICLCLKQNESKQYYFDPDAWMQKDYTTF